MDKTFEEALGELLAEYHETDPDELISAMELQIIAVTENSAE